MKKRLSFLTAGLLLLAATPMWAQSYVNEMLQADIERDCYIEGSALFNDNTTAQYEDVSYVQKATSTDPVSFIFNRDIWGNQLLTGFRVNMLLRKGDNAEQWVKIEYSTDERTYQAVPDMKVEFSYDAVLGNAYWCDVYYQASLPEGTKEIKVTLLAKPDDANWIPCYRRTEIFYAGGTPYQYVTPPNVLKDADTFEVNFEDETLYIADFGGSANSSSTKEVVTDPYNANNKVLKIVQDPATNDWGWGNGDWFGVALSVAQGEDKQLTKVVADRKYLHFKLCREAATTYGMEMWGGSGTLKKNYEFPQHEGWKEIVIDLSEFIDKTFDALYFSPNVLFVTNVVSVPETTYIDDIVLSDKSEPSLAIGRNELPSVVITGSKGSVSVAGAAGERMQVVTIAGCVNEVLIPSDNYMFTMEPGIYLIRVKGQVEKVVVR